MNIKVEEATDLILREKPKAVIIFGASKFLFPHPLRTLAKAAYDVGTHGGYDGSARAAFQWRALSLVHPIPSGSPQFGGYKEDGVIARKLEKANIIIH